MKLGKIISIILILISPSTSESDCQKYEKLEIKDVPSIRKSDLPFEFGDVAFEVVDKFIRKTKYLDYEILLFFDYITGEILRCKIGTESNVEVKFEDGEFDGKHVASIHNHTKDMYTPPSDKNFGIFLRKWEDYELIAGIDGLWILKGKVKDEKLCFELKFISNLLFNMALEDSLKTTESIEDRESRCDENYGILLSKYINNKNLNEIQIIKRGYKND